MTQDSYSTEYKLQSGFTVRVTPLVPYYMDVIEQILPEKKYPKRIIRNIAGDEFPIAYDPPDTPPLIANREEYDLYYEWLSVDQHNEELVDTRKALRSDYLLSTCIEIVDGPVDFDSDEWKLRVEGAFQARGINFKMPSHKGAQLLFFLKSVVITSPDEKALLEQSAMYREVDMQGISNALHGFPVNVGR